MSTLLEKMLLTLDAYEDTSTISTGWQRIAQSSSSTSGFFATAYQKAGEIVVVFRGWDQLDPLDAVNVERAFDSKPYEQIKHAQQFINSVLAANPGASISLTGHSLGGGLAAIMAVRNGLSAETFGQIESVDSALKSMNGYEYDPIGLGFPLWTIPSATHNQNITRLGLSNYAGVTNHVLFGDIALYNDHTVLGSDHIGIDQIFGTALQNGIRTDDSLFGQYLNLEGTAFTEIVPASVIGAPYSEAFATAIHSLGMQSLILTFGQTFQSIAAAEPRLFFQLTNDLLATEEDGSGFYRATFDMLDALMLNHLKAPAGAPTVARGLIGDLNALASAGTASIANTNPDVNTAILQLAIQYASTQTLGDGSLAPKTTGVVSDIGSYLSIALDGPGSMLWHSGIVTAGGTLIRAYASYVLGDAKAFAGLAILDANRLLVEANNGAGTTIRDFNNSASVIFAGSGSDSVVAGNDSDILYGLAGNDTLNGGSGSDIVAGAVGNDRLLGSTGNDVLIAGAGQDTLAGGDGVDLFVFTSLSNGTTGDRIADYSVISDTLVFDNDAFGALGSVGPLSSSAFFVGAAAHDSSDRLIYDSTTGILYFDGDGTGAAAQQRVATLAGTPALTFLDFLII